MFKDIKKLLLDKEFMIVLVVFMIVLVVFIMYLEKITFYQLICFFTLGIRLLYLSEIFFKNQKLKNIEDWTNLILEKKYTNCLELMNKYKEIEINIYFYFLSGFFTTFYLLIDKKKELDLNYTIDFIKGNDILAFLIFIFFTIFCYQKIKQLVLHNEIKEIENFIIKQK